MIKRQISNKYIPGVRIMFVNLAGLTLVFLILLGLNIYKKYQQELVLINYLNHPTVVTLANGREIQVKSRTAKLISMSEGRHILKIKIEGDEPYKKTIHISNTPLQRFKGKNVFVLNIDQSAVLLWEEIIYADDPLRINLKPRSRLFSRKEFFVFRDIDYLFETPPESVNLRSGKNHKGILYVRRAGLSALSRQEAVDLRRRLIKILRDKKTDLDYRNCLLGQKQSNCN